MALYKSSQTIKNGYLTDFTADLLCLATAYDKTGCQELSSLTKDKLDKDVSIKTVSKNKKLILIYSNFICTLPDTSIYLYLCNHIRTMLLQYNPKITYTSTLHQVYIPYNANSSRWKSFMVA